MRLFPRLRAASDELLHLDFLRFIASCGIVLLHFAPFLSPQARALVGPTDGMTIFVDLFFTLSGFVIAYVYAGRLDDWRAYRIFLARRVARLGPLHWATLLVFVATGAMIWTGRMSSDHAEFYDPRCLVPNALAIHAWGVCDQLSFNDVSWSISAELGMYLIAPLLLWTAAWRPLALVLLAGAAIAALSLAPQQPWLAWTSHFGVARAMPGFVLGVALAHWREGIARLPGPRPIALAAFALLLAGIRWEWERIVLLPIVYVVVVATIAADIGGRYRPFRIGALGQLTYSVYMIHSLVRTFVISFVGQRVLGLRGAGTDLMVAAGFALTLALGYWSLVYFEEPARRWLSPRRRAPAVVQPR